MDPDEPCTIISIRMFVVDTVSEDEYGPITKKAHVNWVTLTGQNQS